MLDQQRCVALGGIGAGLCDVRPPAGRWPDALAPAVPGLYQLSLNKFYVDELYAAFIVKPLDGLAAVLPRRSTCTSSTASWT